MASQLTDGYYSLSADINKAPEGDSESVFELLPELELSMSDEELIELSRDWQKSWEPYNKEISEQQLDNENYWLGKQFSVTKEKRPLIDNLIFESLETFLPIATRAKVEPMVESDNTQEGIELAGKVQRMLSYLMDTLAYNLRLKQVTRYWALYMLGVMKVGWSMKENNITCRAIRPQKLILDPTATVEDCDYTGYYIGERLEDMASDLVLRFPSKKEYITDKVKGKMGTTVEYIMWTTDDYVFWTHADQVLAKSKNPHWNYESEQPGQMNEFGQMGQPTKVQGNNHFEYRKKPYIFLNYFNLGKRPHDDTNLIQQNLPLQDSINKRLKQMDKNADHANGGLAVSGDSFTEEQARSAAKAKRDGGVIWVPTGPVTNAVVNLQGEQLPSFVYESLVDYRNELRNIFGVRGSTAQGTIQDKTVRGKMQIKGQDTDRIGGGIANSLEEFSDCVLNWFVQLMYVYYDEPHYAMVLGKAQAQEYIQLSSADFTSKLLIGVKEGSMIPKDPQSQRLEAMELWAQKAIDPITFFDRLEFPDPKESAKNLYLWLSDPIQLFPELAQAQQPPPEEPPKLSIKYDELPPEGQAQVAAKAGIQLDPEQIRLNNVRRKVEEHALSTASVTHAANMKPQPNNIKK